MMKTWIGPSWTGSGSGFIDEFATPKQVSISSVIVRLCGRNGGGVGPCVGGTEGDRAALPPLRSSPAQAHYRATRCSGCSRGVVRGSPRRWVGGCSGVVGGARCVENRAHVEGQGGGEAFGGGCPKGRPAFLQSCMLHA